MASTTTTPIGGGGGGSGGLALFSAARREGDARRVAAYLALPQLGPPRHARRAMGGATSPSQGCGRLLLQLQDGPPQRCRLDGRVRQDGTIFPRRRLVLPLLGPLRHARQARGASPLLPKAAAAASRMGPLKGPALAVGFGRAALPLAAASRSTNSGHLGMAAGLGVVPPLRPRPSAAASRTEGPKGAALPAGSGMAPLSGDGDLEPSLDAKSDQLLQEVKGIHAKLNLLSRALEETWKFRYMLKMIFLKLMVTLVLTSLAMYLVCKVAREMGYADIDRFLKDLFITFITDKDVKATLQEAINSHIDATFEHIVPWKKFKMWWWMNVGRILSRKE